MRFGGQARGGYALMGDVGPPSMIHLSVAIGRFVEALFWGIFRAAGGIAVAVVAAVIVAVAVLAAGSHLWKRRR